MLSRPVFTNLGLLALRLGAGVQLVWLHGLPRLHAFPAGTDSFPDPLGIGRRHSHIATIIGELFCAALVVLGLGTRLAAVLMGAVVAVTTFMVHSGDAWARRESAFLYLASALALVFLGAGRFSLDAFLGSRLGRKGAKAAPARLAPKGAAKAAA